LTVQTYDRESGAYIERPLTTIQRVSWIDHRAYMADEWKAGEHVSVIAQTGGGKTHLVVAGLFPLLENEMVITFDVKGDDPELNAVQFRKITQLPAPLRQRILHGDKPRSRWYKYMALRQDDTRRLLDACYRRGSMVLHFNEIRALTDKTPGLGLVNSIDALWLRGRTRELTIIAETQAPRFVPSSFYEQAQHIYIGSLLDRRAQQRLEEIGGNSDEIQDTVSELRRWEFLYVGPLQEDGKRIMQIVKVDNEQ
jgi:hypothetical protein